MNAYSHAVKTRDASFLAAFDIDLALFVFGPGNQVAFAPTISDRLSTYVVPDPPNLVALREKTR